MPPKKSCTLNFILQILKGQKLAFNNQEVSKSTVARLRELSAKNILAQVLPHPTIEKYLPDKTIKAYRVPSEFIFTIIKTVENGYIQSLINQ